MSISIQGIRIDNVSITREEDGDEITSVYSLISSGGRVLAKQNVNGYQGLEIPIGVETTKLLGMFISSWKKDIQTILGLEEESV